MIADHPTQDPLNPLLTHFRPSARMFYAGTPCGTSEPACDVARGYLHLLSRGRVTIRAAGRFNLLVEEPSAILIPRPNRHRVIIDQSVEADLMCATIDLGSDIGNPLAMLLPETVVMPTSTTPELGPGLSLLFKEAEMQRAGRQVILDLLLQYVLIIVLRHLVETGQLRGGLLAGLADPRLSLSLTAMHTRPAENWSLESLADIAHMSRARFADHFRETIGVPPMSYLTDLRFAIARSLLRRGDPIKTVAAAAGYRSQAAFARSFTRRIGVSPSGWAMTQGRDSSGSDR